MTTGRINQVTAFSLRPRAQARSSRTPHGSGYGTCLSRPNVTALVTARGLDFAQSITLPFPIPSRKHPPLLGRPVTLCQGAHTAHTHTATASTSSSLGSLADPGGSRTGCILNSSPNGIGRSLVQHPLRSFRPFREPVASMLKDIWKMKINSREWYMKCHQAREVSRSQRAAMGQAQSAPVVSPCHPRWCGQRLAEPPAHCLTLTADRRVRLPCYCGRSQFTVSRTMIEKHLSRIALSRSASSVSVPPSLEWTEAC